MLCLCCLLHYLLHCLYGLLHGLQYCLRPTCPTAFSALQIAIEMLESGKVDAVVCVQSDENDRFTPKPVGDSGSRVRGWVDCPRCCCR
jgi:hypothetical protein